MENESNADHGPLIGTEVHSIEPAAEVEYPDELLHALSGTATVQSDQSDSEAEPEGKPAEATLNTLAKQAGLDPEALYKATIALPDEQGTATLEELKNQATAYRKTEGQRTALADEQTEFANEKLRHMQELQAIVASIPKEHQSEQLRQQYDHFEAQQAAQQDVILLQAIPQWADPAVKQQDRDKMAGFISGEYGLPPGLVDLNMPAGLKKLIFDYTDLRSRIADIKGKQKQAKSKGAKVASPQATGLADRQNAAVASAKSGGDRLDAITALLKG